MAGIFDIFTGQSGVDAANAQKAGIAAGQTAATAALNQGQSALTTNAGAAQGALTAGAGAAQGALATNAGAAQGALSTNYAAGLQPYLQNYATANKGVGGLTDALGLTGDPSQVMARLQQTPGYQFQLQQGDENVLRNQARTGALNSGATNLDLQAQGQGLANQTYQQYVQNLQPFLGASNSAAGGIANLDAGLGTGSANISTGLGKDSANISTGLGTGSANLSTGLGTALNQNFGSQANLGYTAATGVGNANANADLAQGKGIANLWGAGMGLAEMAAGMPPTSFGGGGGTTYSGANNISAGQGGGVGFDQNGNPLRGYAEGGKPPVGQPSVVGEKGPELFVPDQPGTVIPNDMASRLRQFFPDQPAAAPSRKNEPRPFQWPPHIGPSSALAQFMNAA